MRVLVVDDHPLFREAVGNSIRQAVADAEIIEAATIDEALDVLSCGGIELTLFDLSLPGTTGLSGLLRLRKAFPGSPIVVISCHKDLLIVASALFSAYQVTSTSPLRRKNSYARSAKCCEVRFISQTATGTMRSQIDPRICSRSS